MTGRPTQGKPINLQQLQAELAAAGLQLGGLSMADGFVFTHDADGIAADFAPNETATVDAVIAAHVAMRDKTDAEYATEFQDADTSSARKQEIRDILMGLLPREQVSE